MKIYLEKRRTDHILILCLVKVKAERVRKTRKAKNRKRKEN